jgi:hypothetical protein
MRTHFLHTAVLMFGIFLSGCAQLPKQAFNKEVAKSVQSLTVTSRADETSYSAVIMGHPGASFGLIGAIVIAAEQATKSSRLTKSLNPEKTRVRLELANELEKALSKAGYRTERSVFAESKSYDDHLNDSLKTQASDAVLVAYLVDASYAAAGTSTPYMPFVSARVKLVSRDGRILYEDLITYGYQLNPNAVHIQAPAEYRFDNMDALVANPDKTREGLVVGVRAIAAQVANDLSK